MGLDQNCLEVFGGIFPSREAAEAFMGLESGRPGRFMEELYLQGEFIGRVEVRFF